MANKAKGKKKVSAPKESHIHEHAGDSSSLLAEVIEETIADAVLEATSSSKLEEIQSEIASLRAYVNDELAPHRALLNKAERLSLNSTNAITIAKTVEDRINSNESQNATVLGKIAELDQSLKDIYSEHQRFSRDSQVALEKASFGEQQLAVNNASLDAVNANMASIGSRLETLEAQMANLSSELQSALSSVASLRSNLNLTRRRGL
jgi:archaellum component FlaC